MIPLISCDSLVKAFPIPHTRDVVRAVNTVSFQVLEGSTLALVGESGSGKTTVGKIILGLMPPTSGHVFFRGEDIGHLSSGAFARHRPKIQAVFQDPYDALDPRMRVADAIMEPLERMRLVRSPAVRRDRLLDLAATVELDTKLLRRYPHQLSGGQQQKVGIARAIASSPDFIVLDEPTSALDLEGRAMIIALLQRLQRDLGVSYLFISHDLTTVERLAHQVAVMYLGKIVERGTAERIFSRPTHPYTRALLASVLRPDPTLRRSVKVLKGEIPSPINLPEGCFFASRCPIGDESCTLSEPPLERMEVPSIEHEVACFKAAESVAGLSTRSSSTA
jgi:oligopeptide/dipeptide ABC transporter ATP-binding protein